ncbi:MAG TPA: glycosyltransferase family 1 protein [Candidatus Levybacteria bacterium]|mgnify:CR=1 FL=1|nr:glycosyltransferase family 1 protein [Candidatus Levybacteria bacterium]
MTDEGTAKKIGIDIRLWNETGIGRYIRNLIFELAKIEYKHKYVLFARPDDIAEIKSLQHISAAKDKFIIIPIDMKWHSIQEQLEFPRILMKYKLNLMHFPYFSVPVFYRKPFVVTVHDLIINHFPTGRATTLPLPLYTLKRAGYELILKSAISGAKKIIVPSEATRRELVDHYKVKQEKIIITQEGIDERINSFTPVVFKEKDPYFLYVGNVYPHKNIEALLEAFKLFLVAHPDIVIKLVGKEDYFYRRLRAYVAKHKIPRVEFMGYVDDAKLSNLYSNAIATVIPSLMEGFGLTALEAMSRKSLVVASKIPALQEVCGKNAIYFDPSDILNIVEAMNTSVSLSKGDKEKRLNDAKKHSEIFTWEKMARQTIAVYDSCL